MLKNSSLDAQLWCFFIMCPSSLKVPVFAKSLKGLGLEFIENLKYHRVSEAGTCYAGVGET